MAIRARSTRPRGTLTVEEIFETALAVIDARGLDALSMRTLAEELGVAAMTLYYYVPTKAALLDGVCRRALASLNVGPSPRAGQREQLTQTLRSMHAALVAHPGTLELFLAPHIDGGPAFDDLRERLLGLLRELGLGKLEAVDALTALISFVIGFASLEISRRRRHSTAGERSRLAGLPGDRFPYLSDAADAWTTRTSQESFVYGLDHLLAGCLRERG